MSNYFKTLVLSAALLVPAGLSAQDRDHQDRDRQDRDRQSQGQNDRQNDRQSRRYEDRAHNDSHEWNATEDQKYRQYLLEHHKKYRDFDRAKQRDQDKYWDWRHNHSDNEEHR